MAVWATHCFLCRMIVIRHYKCITRLYFPAGIQNWGFLTWAMLIPLEQMVSSILLRFSTGPALTGCSACTPFPFQNLLLLWAAISPWTSGILCWLVGSWWVFFLCIIFSSNLKCSCLIHPQFWFLSSLDEASSFCFPTFCLQYCKISLPFNSLSFSFPSPSLPLPITLFFMKLSL